MQTGDQDRDAALFQAIQAGDGDALAELYDKYSSLVYAYAIKWCGDREWAEEVTQDTFVRLWTTKSSFDPKRSQFQTWLLTITRRLTHDKWRKLKNSRPGSREVPEAGWTTTSSELAAGSFAEPVLRAATAADGGSYGEDLTTALAERTWFRQEVFASLQGLTDEERKVVELAYFQGFTLREVAEQLGRPIGTVKTRLNHALAILRSDMKAWKGGFQS